MLRDRIAELKAQGLTILLADGKGHFISGRDKADVS
jgi:hypothetical protein